MYGKIQIFILAVPYTLEMKAVRPSKTLIQATRPHDFITQIITIQNCKIRSHLPQQQEKPYRRRARDLPTYVWDVTHSFPFNSI